MPALELRIPPVAIMLSAAAAMWAWARFLPAFAYAAAWSFPAAVIAATAGAVFCVLGVAGFRRRGTTVDPVRPHKSSALVMEGIYRHSRNPMYAGMALMLAAWALYLENVAAILSWPVAPWYLQRFQIIPEERALAELYGAPYLEYLARVRRWL